MAATTGGLTASIRRKLQDGQAPEDVVRELVAGGLTEVSAQRFVDTALTTPEPEPERQAPRGSRTWMWLAAGVVAVIAGVGVYASRSAGTAPATSPEPPAAAAPSSAPNIDPRSLAAPATSNAVKAQIVRFENTTQPEIQCDIAHQLATAQGDEAGDVVDGLMEHYDELPAQVKGCVRDTVSRLDPEAKFPATER